MHDFKKVRIYYPDGDRLDIPIEEAVEGIIEGTFQKYDIYGHNIITIGAVTDDQLKKIWRMAYES